MYTTIFDTLHHFIFEMSYDTSRRWANQIDRCVCVCVFVSFCPHMQSLHFPYTNNSFYIASSNAHITIIDMIQHLDHFDATNCACIALTVQVHVLHFCVCVCVCVYPTESVHSTHIKTFSIPYSILQIYLSCVLISFLTIRASVDSNYYYYWALKTSIVVSYIADLSQLCRHSFTLPALSGHVLTATWHRQYSITNL